MLTITYDIESTNLPDFKWKWETDYAKYPDIASIAWQVHEDGKLLYEQYNYIKPDGWEMSEGAGAINGLTMEMLNEKGLDCKSVLRHLMLDMAKCDRIVAHNISFDMQMLKTTLLKLGVDKEYFNPILDKEKRYCTMMKGKTHLGVSKWPKLVEIYNEFFNEEFDAHDALADVKACHRVYLELIK